MPGNQPGVRSLYRRLVVGVDAPAGGTTLPAIDVPQTGHHIRIYYSNVRTDSSSHSINLTLVFNSDTNAANYNSGVWTLVSGVAGAEQTSTGAAFIGRASGTADNTAIGGTGSALIIGYSDIGAARGWHADCVYANSTTQTTGLLMAGFWTNTTSPIQTLTFGLAAGNFVSGSFDIYLER